MKRAIPAILSCAVLLAANVWLGCAQPTSSAAEVEEQPFLVVEGASETARLIVDGIDVGSAWQFGGEGKMKLRVLPGRHRVVVVDNGRSLYDKEIFLTGAMTKVIRVTGAP